MRIFLDTDDEDKLAIAAAQSCTVHIQMTFGDSSSKDSTGDWQEQEPTGMNWDVQTEALVLSERNDDGEEHAGITAQELEVGKKYMLYFAKSGGTQNREIDDESTDILLSGEAVLSDLSINASNRENSTYNATFTGVGELALPEEESVAGEHEGTTTTT